MKYRIYNNEDREQVKKLFEDGKNKCEISRITGIPRCTLRDWIIRKPSENPRNSYVPIIDFNSYLDTVEKRKAYAFILAIYLCDGCISQPKSFRAPVMRMTNDSKYPINTQEWCDKLQIIFPDNIVACNPHKHSNCNIVRCYSKKLIDLFPQHSTDKKHNRKLTFEPWQLDIINKYPDLFIRGCIQSDGCVYFAKQDGKYNYKRYAFTNKSNDIMDLFVNTLKLIGIDKKPHIKHTGIMALQIQTKKDVLIMEKIISIKE